MKRKSLRFSPIENQAGERVEVVNHLRLGSQRTATPTAQGMLGLPTLQKRRVGLLRFRQQTEVVTTKTP